MLVKERLAYLEAVIKIIKREFPKPDEAASILRATLRINIYD